MVIASHLGVLPVLNFEEFLLEQETASIMYRFLLV